MSAHTALSCIKIISGPRDRNISLMIASGIRFPASNLYHMCVSQYNSYTRIDLALDHKWDGTSFVTWETCSHPFPPIYRGPRSITSTDPMRQSRIWRLVERSHLWVTHSVNLIRGWMIRTPTFSRCFHCSYAHPNVRLSGESKHRDHAVRCGAVHTLTVRCILSYSNSWKLA